MRRGEAVTPVLEVGGTHVTAALVDAVPLAVRSTRRVPLDAQGSADSIMGELVAAARALGELPPSTWGVAIPGPFDYEAGVGRFAGVAKFDALNGVDVGAWLTRELASVEAVGFLNDADAFGLGEAVAGAGRGLARSVTITLGTGVGSAFVRDGACVHDGDDVPPGGYAHELEVAGKPLEETASRRAIMAGYRARGGADLDVADIAGLAIAGEAAALGAFRDAYEGLAVGLAPYLIAFEAEALIIGGSIARSWQLVESILVPALRRMGASTPVKPCERPDHAPLIGAAWFVRTVE